MSGLKHVSQKDVGLKDVSLKDVVVPLSTHCMTSWIMLFSLSMANADGKNVLYYSHQSLSYREGR